MFGGIPDFRAELVRSADDGHTCWTEWHWWGNRADGQPLDMRGVALFELQDGLIVGGRLYMEPVEHRSNIEDAVEMQSGVPPAD
jgi:ketosteroid isomerase-like protein